MRNSLWGLALIAVIGCGSTQEVLKEAKSLYSIWLEQTDGVFVDLEPGSLRADSVTIRIIFPTGHRCLVKLRFPEEPRGDISKISGAFELSEATWSTANGDADPNCGQFNGQYKFELKRDSLSVCKNDEVCKSYR